MSVKELMERLKYLRAEDDATLHIMAYSKDGQGITWVVDVKGLGLDADGAVYLETKEKMTRV